jgi:hypothetical protein
MWEVGFGFSTLFRYGRFPKEQGPFRGNATQSVPFFIQTHFSPSLGASQECGSEQAGGRRTYFAPVD